MIDELLRTRIKIKYIIKCINLPCTMAITKKVKLDIEIEVDMPLDIIEDRDRFKAIETGLVRSISKGLYEQGVSFSIGKVKIEP